MIQRRTLLRTGAVAALAAPALVGFAQQSVTLKFHTFMGPLSDVWLTMHKPWMDKVEKESGGRIRFEGYPAFIDEMVAKHQFKREELVRTFKRAEHKPDVIAAISKPATMKPWAEYRAAFINQQRIDGGIKFWNKHEATLKRAEKQFGVPQE